MKYNIMAGRNKNIYFQEETYNRLLQITGAGKLSKFVNEAVEEKLRKTEQEKKEELRQKLIAGYKVQAKNEKLRKVLRVYGEMSWEDINIGLTRRERKNNEQNK